MPAEPEFVINLPPLQHDQEEQEEQQQKEQQTTSLSPQSDARTYGSFPNQDIEAGQEQRLSSSHSKLYEVFSCLVGVVGLGYIVYQVVSSMVACEQAGEICHSNNMTYVTGHCPPSADHCGVVGRYGWCDLFCQNAVEEAARAACRCLSGYGV